MPGLEVDYYRRRAAQERDLARRARVADAANAHRQLAELYEARIVAAAPVSEGPAA